MSLMYPEPPLEPPVCRYCGREGACGCGLAAFFALADEWRDAFVEERPEGEVHHGQG